MSNCVFELAALLRGFVVVLNELALDDDRAATGELALELGASLVEEPFRIVSEHGVEEHAARLGHFAAPMAEDLFSAVHACPPAPFAVPLTPLVPSTPFAPFFFFASRFSSASQY